MSLRNLLFAGLVLALPALAHGAEHEKIATLQEHALPDATGKKGLLIEVSYKPGEASAPHVHAGAVFAYVLEGAVVSDFLNFKDLSPLIGADSAQSKANRGAKEVQPPDKVLPVESFRTERWTSIDADVQFSGKKIVREKQLPIDNLVTRIRLQDGEMALAPLKFGIAGGNLVSNIRLNGRSKPVKADMRLSARHLKLKQLFPTISEMRPPCSVRANRSRPRLSVPNQCPPTKLGAAPQLPSKSM